MRWSNIHRRMFPQNESTADTPTLWSKGHHANGVLKKYAVLIFTNYILRLVHVIIAQLHDIATSISPPPPHGTTLRHPTPQTLHAVKVPLFANRVTSAISSGCTLDTSRKR